MERREEQRLRSLLGGVISFNRRYSPVNCTIRNLSPAGARIQFDNNAVLPAEFDLTLTTRGKSYLAKTVWRGHDSAGVCFIDPDNKGSDKDRVEPLDLATRLTKSHRLGRTLEQRIADISGGKT
jgi:hypothetical protein